MFRSVQPHACSGREVFIRFNYYTYSAGWLGMYILHTYQKYSTLSREPNLRPVVFWILVFIPPPPRPPHPLHLLMHSCKAPTYPGPHGREHPPSLSTVRGVPAGGLEGALGIPGTPGTVCDRVTLFRRFIHWVTL